MTLMGSKLYITPKSTDIISNLVIGKNIPITYPVAMANIAFIIYNFVSNKTASLLKPKNLITFCIGTS
ncbi:hypothetical protein SDC9_175899 [bioreactor metagenome]|uniref:Uncharacterized protein n=1 Tax=bioreactor metagenome TaxID=1076179 RepID=A0A645GNL9_9ZZZZ